MAVLVVKIEARRRIRRYDNVELARFAAIFLKKEPAEHDFAFRWSVLAKKSAIDFLAAYTHVRGVRKNRGWSSFATKNSASGFVVVNEPFVEWSLHNTLL